MKHRNYTSVLPPLRSQDFGFVDSDTAILPDRWDYHWRGAPPSEFKTQKVRFHQLTPADIKANNWRVLEPAVHELVESLRLDPKDTKLAWLSLNLVPDHACIMGVYGGNMIVAASPITSMRSIFYPYNYYKKLSEDPQWRNLYYHSRLRQFVAKFDIGVSFYAARRNLLCDVEYYASFGIHGKHSIWALLRIQDRVIAVPDRLALSGNPTLKDLPGRVQSLNNRAQSFIQKLGSYWFRPYDEKDYWNIVQKVVTSLSVPAFRLNELKTDNELYQCRTKLDLLFCLSKLLSFESLATTNDLLKLSRSICYANI